MCLDVCVWECMNCVNLTEAIREMLFVGICAAVARLILPRVKLTQLLLLSLYFRLNEMFHG